MVALSSSLQMNSMFSYYHRKKFYKLQNSNIMVLYEIGGRYACSYRHGCAKSRYRRAQSGAQRAKQSKAKQRYYVSSPKRKCARKESSVSRGELSSKQLVACWHTYCQLLLLLLKVLMFDSRNCLKSVICVSCQDISRFAIILC